MAYRLRRGYVTMTAEPSPSPVTEGIRSLEVRWIFPGQMESAVSRWFGRFPTVMETRHDSYLLDPQLSGLSVKVRGGRALEVKAYRGSAGMLEVASRALGRMESWQKSSFPLRPPVLGGSSRVGWRSVSKRRHISRFSLANGRVVTRDVEPGRQPRCDVELTEVQASNQDWWTLGFEATGPTDLLHRMLQNTAALVFTSSLPGKMHPGPDESRSYAEWLGQLSGVVAQHAAVDAAASHAVAVADRPVGLRLPDGRTPCDLVRWQATPWRGTSSGGTSEATTSSARHLTDNPLTGDGRELAVGGLHDT